MINKGSDKNVANIEDDVDELKSIMNLRTDSGFAYSQKNTLSLQKAIKNVLADYTRQKEMNEEHQKINGELRQAINTVEKEKADWIKAYQEEKDSQFELLKRIKELEEESRKKSIELICYQEELENSIPTQVVEELKNSITLDNTIVGGRRNGKTLEYGIKLGKIKACEKLLEELSFNLRHNRAKIYEQGEK